MTAHVENIIAFRDSARLVAGEELGKRVQEIGQGLMILGTKIEAQYYFDTIPTGTQLDAIVDFARLLLEHRATYGAAGAGGGHD